MSTHAVEDQQLPADADDVAQRTVAFFAAAAGDATHGDRIARAGTVLHVHLGEDAGITLRLDRTPIAAEARVVGEAEAAVWCSPADWRRFMLGERRLAMSIMQGEVEFSGPIRKFLTITPILRTLDPAAWHGA